jgi:hypothetical protein
MEGLRSRARLIGFGITAWLFGLHGTEGVCKFWWDNVHD